MRVGIVLKDADEAIGTIGAFQKDLIDAAIFSPRHEHLGFGEYAVGVDKVTTVTADKVIRGLLLDQFFRHERRDLAGRTQPDVQCGRKDEASAILPPAIVLVYKAAYRIAVGELVNRWSSHEDTRRALKEQKWWALWPEPKLTLRFSAKEGSIPLQADLVEGRIDLGVTQRPTLVARQAADDRELEVLVVLLGFSIVSQVIREDRET